MEYNFLIVDDSATVRKVLLKVLQNTTFNIKKISEAENGQKALDKLSENSFDLVFLDLNMPEMDGFSFLYEIRKLQKFKDLPVVIISTEGNEDRKKKLFELGVKDFMRKPITPQKLNELLDRILN
jgi:two-component system, chemotaxis family, chemotaxis protein CheY